MKTKILTLLIAVAFATTANAQKLSTRSGYVKFFSATPVEDIEAENNQVSSVIDFSSGNFAFLVPIKGFVFEKALMQEHFNENYMESGTYPKSTFKGSIADFNKIDISKDGEYKTTMKGTMNIHGTDREIEVPVTFLVKDGRVQLNSTFKLKPEDYGVKIPDAKRDNISETLDMTVKIDYDKA